MSARQDRWLGLLIYVLLLVLIVGVSIVWLLLRPSVDTLGAVALIVMWVYFGIPACCRLRR